MNCCSVESERKCSSVSRIYDYLCNLFCLSIVILLRFEDGLNECKFDLWTPHLPPTPPLLLLQHIISRFSTTTTNIESQQCKISNFLSSIALLVFSMIQIRDRKSSTRAYHTKWGNEMMIIFLLAKGFSTSSIFSSPNENIIFNKLVHALLFQSLQIRPTSLFLYISTHIIVYPSPDFAIFHSRSNKIRMKMEFISSRKFIQCSSSIGRTCWSQRVREKSLQWIDCELFRFKHIQHSHIIYLDRINMIFIFRKVRVEFAESKLPHTFTCA